MTFDLDALGLLTVETFEFSFRNEGQFKIPKEVREVAYTMAIDIQIESVSRNLYANGKAKPPIEFYGYASMVEQDALRPPVPIVFPRQRLYYDRQFQALTLWQNEKKFWENWQYHRRNETLLAGIYGALGIPFEEQEQQTSTFNWKEIPLREVYIKVIQGTQFTVSGLYLKPFPYEDPYGNIKKGESFQEDGEEDEGLPRDGIRPKRNPSNNPFSGNRAANGTNNNPNFGLGDEKLDGEFGDGIESGELQQTCNVTIDRIDRVDGGVNSTNTFNEIELPADESFIVENEQDPDSPTGFYSYVRLKNSGLYFNGSGFTTAKTIWSEDEIVVTALCLIDTSGV